MNADKVYRWMWIKAVQYPPDEASFATSQSLQGALRLALLSGQTSVSHTEPERPVPLADEATKSITKQSGIFSIFQGINTLSFTRAAYRRK